MIYVQMPKQEQQPALRQTDCYTLRQAIETEMKALQKRIEYWPEGTLEHERLFAQKDTYQRVLWFIRDMQP